MSMLIAALLAATATSGRVADYCHGSIPSDLSRQLLSSHPGYRIPVASDNLAEDVNSNRSRGGSGCLAVAKGDFDGDGRVDLVVALRSRGHAKALVVVGLRGSAGWRLETIGTWGVESRSLFVDADKPGSFTRTEALDGPVSGNGEVMSMKCPHDVAIFGAVESTATAYCRESAAWLHVQIED